MPASATFVSTSGQQIVVGTPLGHQRFLNGRLVAVEPELIEYLRSNAAKFSEWRELTEAPRQAPVCGETSGKGGPCQVSPVEGRSRCMAHDSPDAGEKSRAVSGAQGNLRVALQSAESAGDRNTSGVPDAEMEMMTPEEREQGVAYLETHDPFFKALKRGAR